MAPFEGDENPIYAFEIEDAYYFSQYFEQEDLFDVLQEYYDPERYRFEVPAQDLGEVREVLESYYYDPIVVEDPAPYIVVKEQYTEHADILRNSIMHWSRRGYNFFLMKDEQAVAQAVEDGAIRIEETEFVAGI